MFNEDNIVEQLVLDTMSGGTPSDMAVDDKEKIYPQITQINTDSNLGINLRTSAKSADKRGTIHV